MIARPRWLILPQRLRTSSSAPLYGLLALASGCMLGLAHETGLRQPAAYLDPTGTAARWCAGASACAGLVIGFALAFPVLGRRDPRREIPWAAGLSSLVASASGALWCLGFRGWLGLLALVVPALGCALAALTLILLWRSVGRYAAQLGTFEWALSPFRLFGTAVAFGLAVVASAHVGVVRSGALLGLGISAVAVGWPQLLGWLERRAAPRARSARAFAAAGFVAGTAALLAAERLVPLGDLWRYPGEVVFTVTTARSHYVVTSGQDAFALFRDGRMELSTVDDYRYAEALTHPALASASTRARVALLGGGKGMVEREILRWRDVQELTVVTEDAAFCAVSRQIGWFRARSEDSLASARVQIVEAEPIVWLDTRRERWDVILVDLPDPSSYYDAKSYTRLFYELVRARLLPHGIVVVQATSPFRSPRSFASVERTLRAAGFTTLPYRAPVPTLGEWGFVLAALRSLSPPSSLPPGTRFLDGAGLTALFARPPDVISGTPGLVNVMNDMRLLDVFEQESPP